MSRVGTGRSAWNYGLTEAQTMRCRQVMREHGDPKGYESFYSPAVRESPYRGWSVWRLPSTINPPRVVRMRYRGVDGRLLIDVDCS